jgi:hypothetical protein
MPAATMTKPTAVNPNPMAERSPGRSRPVAAWLTVAAAKITNSVTPASSRLGWCRVPPTKPGASAVNRPRIANALLALATAVR